MERLTREVINAAIKEAPLASQHWQSAKQISPVADWPDECARLLPEIYLNLSTDRDPEISGLAKGVYRQSWSRNVRLLQAASKFAAALETAGIDYRLIKGAALIAIHGKYGLRRMGDVDWVLPRSSGTEIIEILKRIGFAPRYIAADPRRSEIWDDEEGNCFDLHLIGPNSWLNCAFSGAQKKAAFGVEFRLPTYESLALITAKHSLIGGSATDLAQGIVDIALLEELIDSTKLTEQIVQLGQYRALSRFFDYLGDFGIGLSLNRLTLFEKLRNFGNSLRIKLFAERVWRRPLVNKIRLNQITNVRALAHAIWAGLAALGPIERLVVKVFGGFLPIGAEARLHEGTLSFDHSQVTSSNPNISVRIITTNELRIACRKPKGVAADLEMKVSLENETPRRIFINGFGQGHFTPKYSPQIALPLPASAGQIEISLRDFSFTERAWIGEMNFKVKVKE